MVEYCKGKMHRISTRHSSEHRRDQDGRRRALPKSTFKTHLVTNEAGMLTKSKDRRVSDDGFIEDCAE